MQQLLTRWFTFLSVSEIRKTIHGTIEENLLTDWRSWIQALTKNAPSVPGTRSCDAAAKILRGLTETYFRLRRGWTAGCVFFHQVCQWTAKTQGWQESSSWERHLFSPHFPACNHGPHRLKAQVLSITPRLPAVPTEYLISITSPFIMSAQSSWTWCLKSGGEKQIIKWSAAVKKKRKKKHLTSLW